jgi:hypothetical protein
MAVDTMLQTAGVLDTHVVMGIQVVLVSSMSQQNGHTAATQAGPLFPHPIRPMSALLYILCDLPPPSGCVNAWHPSTLTRLSLHPDASQQGASSAGTLA